MKRRCLISLFFFPLEPTSDPAFARPGFSLQFKAILTSSYQGLALVPARGLLSDHFAVASILTNIYIYPHRSYRWLNSHYTFGDDMKHNRRIQNPQAHEIYLSNMEQVQSIKKGMH